MSEAVLRAMWFALFATMAMILGGFALGYGTAMLASPTPAPASVPLPTLAPVPEAGTDRALEEVAVGGSGDGGSAGATVSPAAEAAGAVGAKPAPTRSPLATEQPGPARLAISLDSVDVNTALGGVEIVLQLHNPSSQSVSFSFWPTSDLTVVDNRGQRYELRWAEFEGTVRVAPRGGVRLVRAFFEGAPAADTRYLTVTAGHPPQLPEARWRVPVGR